MKWTQNDLIRSVKPGEDAVQRVAPGVDRVPILFVNAYLVGERGGPWVLVDAGLPSSASRIRAAAERRHGTGARPEAVILTHGHFDHAGSAFELASDWDVPIFAHALELPFLTGRSDYPPQDPTIGGAMAFLSRFFPTRGYDFGNRVRPLPDDGGVPGLPAWRWLHTPGHTPGHVSLLRDEDGVLLAGDAVATMDLDSWKAQVTHAPRLDRPPAPFTLDWQEAARSVERLAALEPNFIAAGHGVPVLNGEAHDALRTFAASFPAPEHGRYVNRPPRLDPDGTAWLPPAPPDPVPAGVTAAIFGAAAIAAVAVTRRLRS